MINGDADTISNCSNKYGLTVKPYKVPSYHLGLSTFDQKTKIDIDKLSSILFNASIIPLSSSVKKLGLLND